VDQYADAVRFGLRTVRSSDWDVSAELLGKLKTHLHETYDQIQAAGA